MDNDDDIAEGVMCRLRWYKDGQRGIPEPAPATLTRVDRDKKGRVYRVTARDEETGNEVEARRYTLGARTAFRGLADYSSGAFQLELT